MASPPVSPDPETTRNSVHLDLGDCQFNLKNIIRVLVKANYLNLLPLAVELGLERELGEIEAEGVADQRRKCIAQKWLKKGGASWEVLVRALRNTTIREDVLARDLEIWCLRRDSGTSTFSSSSSSEPYSPRPIIPAAVVSTEESVATRMRALAEVDVRDSFGTLVALLASKLSEKQSRNELDIKSFYLYLSNVFPSQSLPNAVDVLMIFRDINAQELWDYQQYETVECIGLRYLPGDKELASTVDKHREMVNNYLATQRIADYIEAKKERSETEGFEFELTSLNPSFHGRRTSKNYYDRLAVTLCNVSIRMKTLKYVRDLWRKIKREFHLPHCNALLDCIYEGSIIILWLITPSASKVLLEPQPWSAIHYIQRELIVNMTLNDHCIYNIQDSKNLLELCHGGSFEEVKSLLRSKDKGAAVNATFEEVYEGKSALMLVCERDHISLLLTVLDGGAEVNFQQQTTGQSALHIAGRCGYLRVTRFLQAYGADPDLVDLAGRSPSQVASQKVSQELSKGKSKSKIRTQNPLQHASDKIEEFTDILLAPGLKLYHRAAKRLVGASRSNHLGSVRYIINNTKNLDINARESDKHGWTALMWATDKENMEMVELLLANNAETNIAAKNNQWTALMLATRQGQLKMVKVLLDHGADPNAQNDKGVSSMSLAVYEHHPEIAMLLVHRGAEVNIIEEDGNSPLTHACVEEDMELVKLFCDYGAELNHQGVKGCSPVMEAARKGYNDIVVELAERGADLNVVAEAGEAAIHAATVKDHADVVKTLARYNAYLNMPNKDGLTALMVAADKGYLDIVEALIEGGVDVNYKHQATGWPAIFFAAKNGRVDVVWKLLQFGARTELETGLKLVDVASFFKRKAIVDVIKKKPPIMPSPPPPVIHKKPVTEKVPGLEPDAVGIELTSFTKTEASVDDSTQLDTPTRPAPDLSHDLESITSNAEHTVDIEQKQLEKTEVKIEEVPLSELKESSKVEETGSLEPHPPSHETGEEEPTEVIKSESETTDKSQPDATESDKDQDVPKPSNIVQPERKDLKEQTSSSAAAEEEQREQSAPESEVQPTTDKVTPTTTQPPPEQVQDESQQSQQSNQSNIAIENMSQMIEMLIKGIDQRMNIENVKRSRGKGVADIQKPIRPEEIAI